MLTIAEAVRRGTRQLGSQPEVARDAEMLLMHALHLGRAAVFAHPERFLTAEQEQHYAALLAQRMRALPMQYITGEQEFFGLRFRVTPDVLIPRPETEHLVEAVLERLPHDRPVAIADVGTGSGAISVALAHALPLAHVAALDLSGDALLIARENAAAHDVGGRLRFEQSDLLDAVADQTFDAVVSNPPYLAFAERAALHEQVRAFEPAMALFAGETGLEIYERLIPQAAGVLRPGGLLALEIGFGQRESISHLLQDWQNVSFVDDLQGIPRVALALRK